MTFILLLEEANLTKFVSVVPTELYASTNTWLLMGDYQVLGGISFPIDSQVFIFQSGPEVTIREVYNIGGNMEQSVKEFGTWNKDVLTVNNLPIFERRKNFEGYRFHGECMIEPPYIYGDNKGNVWDKNKTKNTLTSPHKL